MPGSPEILKQLPRSLDVASLGGLQEPQDSHVWCKFRTWAAAGLFGRELEAKEVVVGRAEDPREELGALVFWPKLHLLFGHGEHSNSGRSLQERGGGKIHHAGISESYAQGDPKRGYGPVQVARRQVDTSSRQVEERLVVEDCSIPSEYLERVLWLESDRMESLLGALTQAKLDNQRDVVKNERRQNYEDRPYGLAFKHLANNLFPKGHPYHHLPIGSHADLTAASLDDVRAFFKRYYCPANAIITITGDFDSEETLGLVERYFGDIAPGTRSPKPVAQPVKLTSIWRQSGSQLGCPAHEHG